MERFQYLRADSVTQAVALLNAPAIRSRVLAGGTDLMLLARETPGLCDCVVDITQITELHRIVRLDDQVTIGAAATFSEVMASPVVNETACVLAQACRQVGAVQVRNMGTIGGNVANAAACADSLPALVCLDAVARVLTPGHAEEWPVADLVLAPNRTRIPAGGLLASLSYRVAAPGSRSVFLKLGRRNAMAISRLTVAALGRIDDGGRIAEARLVPGAATPRLCRFAAVEGLLLGQLPCSRLFEEAGAQAVAEMARISGHRWSSEYKEPALSALVAHALQQVFVPGSGEDE
jgi:CO/xanthine dehydrogenase FAD-binding subunit